MRTNLRTESGRYGCRSRVICCRIKHPTLHKTKEAADLWIASPDGRKWEEQKLAKYKKDRPYPCGFCGGSLCANSGHSLSTTARISSEIWSMCSISSDPVDALVHRVFDFHGGPPLLELGTLDEMQRPRPSIFTVQRIRSAGLLGLSGGRAQSGVGIEVSMTLHESNHGTQNGKNGPVH
jgi:hypothetical protein